MMQKYTSKFQFNQKFNVGPWSQEESIKYLIFLDENKIIMASKQKKKKYRVFDQMSDFVLSRSSLQCRSHHQKTIQKFKEIKTIIAHQKHQLMNIDYRTKFKQLKQNAKVKQDYENPLKNMNFQQNEKQLEQKIIPNQNIFNSYGVPLVPEYINMIPTQLYSFISITNPPQFIPNYYFLQNYPTN